MNHKQKLAYIALGGILVVMGLLISYMVSEDVTAQEDRLKPVVDRKAIIEAHESIVGPNPPADISVSEYLNLVFGIKLERPVVVGNERGFELMTPHVWFVHVDGVFDGLVYMICSYFEEEMDESELKAGIERVGSNNVGFYKSVSQWPNVKKRWFPSDPLNHFVIRHVRNGAPNETLAVTLNGVTYFDQAMIDTARWKVKGAGGNWNALK